MILINDITRLVIVALSIAVVIHWLVTFRRNRPRKILAVLFPLVWASQIILFFIFQRSGAVDPLLLNWFSQLIRLQALLYFLLVAV